MSKTSLMLDTIFPADADLLIHLDELDVLAEIISLGHLPNNLTVEKIRAGNSNIRNPILVSYVAKGLLPYRGLGSGITRALAAWPDIDFASDHEGCLFTATVHRHALADAKVAPEETSGKMSGKILAAVRKNTSVTIPDLAELIGVTERSVERSLQKLQNEGHLRRIGPAKGGHWEILE